MSEYFYYFLEYNSLEFDYELMENKYICLKNFLFDIIIIWLKKYWIYLFIECIIDIIVLNDIFCRVIF